jgi:hypothetical protein
MFFDICCVGFTTVEKNEESCVIDSHSCIFYCFNTLFLKPVICKILIFSGNVFFFFV